MEEKLEQGDCIDVSGFAQTADGDYILPDFVDGVDYCDKRKEDWIWSIGRFPDGRILASTSGKFYQNPNCECLWLR